MSTPPSEVFYQGFTRRYPDISNVLITPVKIKQNYDLATPPVSDADYNAIWDTGATNSVISKKVVEDLNLAPTGMIKMQGVHGVHARNTYLVCIHLPSEVYFPALEVMEGDLGDVDALIGMDIISKGDFAVSNANGKTTFSFRTPSLQEIDLKVTPPKA